MTHDVIAVNIETSTIRLLAEDKTEPNAEAIMKMAIMRRGVDEEFYVVVDHGMYKEGDKWTNDKIEFK